MTSDPPSSRPPHSSRPPQRSGTYRVRRLSEAVSETLFDGYLTPDVFAASDAEFWRVSGMPAVPYSVLDAASVTGFDRSIATSAVPAIALFKERGGREYLMITTSSALRMIGSALGTSCRVPFRFFDTRAEAFEHLRAVGAW